MVYITRVRIDEHNETSPDPVSAGRVVHVRKRRPGTPEPLLSPRRASFGNNQLSVMSLLRLAARRAPKALPLGRRGYAEVSDKIKLSLVLPHQVRLARFEARQRN
jgi:hypothetical protein